MRATGRTEAGADPALASIVADAAHYMQSSRTAQDGATRVVFDGAALATAITAAGRSLWDSSRPFTLVVLSPPPARWEEALGEYILDVADVLSSPEPHEFALTFARSVFQHACIVCDWDPGLAASAEGIPPPVA